MPDINKAVKDFKEIRDSGEFNMFTERQQIMQYANEKNYFSLVSYCGNDAKKYLEVLQATQELEERPVCPICGHPTTYERIEEIKEELAGEYKDLIDYLDGEDVKSLLELSLKDEIK